MSDDSRLGGTSSALFDGRYDRLAAVGALVLAVLMFPLRFVMSHLYASTFPIVVGVAAILAILALRGESRGHYPLSRLNDNAAFLLASVVMVGTALLVAVAAFTGERSVGFYLLAGVVGAVLVAQPLFVSERSLRPRLVLGQLLVLALVLRFGALYTTPGMIGVDPWSHVAFVEAVRSQHSVAAIGTKYVASPLYHLLAAFVSMAADVSARNAIYLSVGLTYTVLLFFVYAVARAITTVRWSLLATVLYVLSDQTIRWGITVIPTTMAIGLFLAALYFLVRMMADEATVRDLVLLTFCIVGITLTHQVSSFVMLMTLCATLAASVFVSVDTLFPEPSGTNVLGLVGFNAGLIVLVWSYTPYLDGTFTTVMFERIYGAVSGAGLFQNTSSAKNVASTAGGDGGSAFLTQVVAYMDVLPFLVILVPALVGAVYLLRANRASHARLAALLTICVMSVFALGLPVLGISTFVPGRWYAFMYALLAIVGAVGIRYLAYNLDPRLSTVAIVVLLLTFPAISVVGVSATPDNPVIDSQQVRKGYSAHEVTAVRTISDASTPDSPTRYTDDPYRSVFHRSGMDRVGKVVVPENETPPHEVVVYREYQSDGAPILFTANRTSKLEQVPRSRMCPTSRNTVYQNGEVAVCTTSN